VATSKIKTQCPNCKIGEVTFEIEQPAIFNGEGCSVIVLRHTKPGCCTSCQSEMVPTIGNASLNFTGALPTKPESLIAKPNGSGIVIPH